MSRTFARRLLQVKLNSFIPLLMLIVFLQLFDGWYLVLQSPEYLTNIFTLFTKPCYWDHYCTIQIIPYKALSFHQQNNANTNILWSVHIEHINNFSVIFCLCVCYDIHWKVFTLSSTYRSKVWNDFLLLFLYSIINQFVIDEKEKASK